MGGNALKYLGIETTRVSTNDFNRIGKHFQKLLKDKLDLDTYIVKSYHKKQTHGDLDLLLKVDHEFHNKGINIKKWIEENVDTKGIHNNGGVYSFEFENFQIDFIPVKESNWEVCKFFFDYSPGGNLLGKIAHKFGCKYGFNGLVYPFRNFNGRVSKDIVLSKDPKKIFEFLDVDYDKYLKGFDTENEIFQWIIDSKYFSSYNFQWDNLNHIDRKRNLKRPDYNRFLNYINENNIEGDYNFNKNKEDYLPLLNEFFSEVNLLHQFEKLKEDDERNKLVSEKFNGRKIMERHPNLKGKDLGNAITNFKSKYDDFKSFVIENEEEDIYTEFKKSLD